MTKRERQINDKLQGDIIKHHLKMLRLIKLGGVKATKSQKLSEVRHVLYQDYREDEYDRLAPTVRDVNALARELKEALA